MNKELNKLRAINLSRVGAPQSLIPNGPNTSSAHSFLEFDKSTGTKERDDNLHQAQAIMNMDSHEIDVDMSCLK